MPAALAASCAVSFIAILGLSAYWDTTIRWLHVFEAVPYAAVAVLCLRRNKWGYYLGGAAGAFWLWMAGTRTTFVKNGFERLAMLATTGTVDRWDQFIAAPAAVATAGLAVCSMWGYARSSKSSGDLRAFVLTLLSVVAYFAAIFWLFAPQYLRLFPALVP